VLEKEINQMNEKIDFLRKNLLQLAVYERISREIDEKREKVVNNINHLIRELNEISTDLTKKFWDYKKFLHEVGGD